MRDRLNCGFHCKLWLTNTREGWTILGCGCHGNIISKKRAGTRRAVSIAMFLFVIVCVDEVKNKTKITCRKRTDFGFVTGIVSWRQSDVFSLSFSVRTFSTHRGFFLFCFFFFARGEKRLTWRGRLTTQAYLFQHIRTRDLSQSIRLINVFNDHKLLTVSALTDPSEWEEFCLSLLTVASTEAPKLHIPLMAINVPILRWDVNPCSTLSKSIQEPAISPFIIRDEAANCSAPLGLSRLAFWTPNVFFCFFLMFGTM